MKRLKLSRQTLRALSQREVVNAQGGGLGSAWLCSDAQCQATTYFNNTCFETFRAPCADASQLCPTAGIPEACMA